VNVFALRKVRRALASPKTFSEIKSSTRIPDRTLRYNLSILKKEGALKEISKLSDMRRKIFILNKIQRRL